MLQDVDQERRYKAEKELEAKLQEHVDTYNESQRLLKALQKNKEKWEENMAKVNTKTKNKYSLRRNIFMNPWTPPLFIKGAGERGVRAHSRYGLYFQHLFRACQGASSLPLPHFELEENGFSQCCSSRPADGRGGRCLYKA